MGWLQFIYNIHILGIDFILVVTENVDLQEISNVFIKKERKVEIGARINRALRFIEVSDATGLLTIIFC